MKFSEQYQRYVRQFGDSLPPPLGAITCTWMKRDRGRLPKLTKVVVSAEAAAHFRIDAPCLLDKERTLRIMRWQKARCAKVTE